MKMIDQLIEKMKEEEKWKNWTKKK
jgi:hypothetical protein